MFSVISMSFIAVEDLGIIHSLSISYWGVQKIQARKVIGMGQNRQKQECERH